jgi:MYXO-CTERM domain-containing protein
MKKTLIALMALAGVACAAPLTLDTKLTDANEAASSFYEVMTNTTHVGYKVELAGTQAGGSLTFYIDVAELFGADALVEGYTYQLTSISWLPNSKNDYTGGSRSISISNGTDSVQASYPTSATDGVYSVTFDSSLSISSASQLTVTLSSTASAEGVGFSTVDRTDAAAKGCSVTGATWGYVDGSPVYDRLVEFEGEDGFHRPHMGTAYNDIAIRLTVVPEPATATLSLLALAGLCARRRRA